MHEPRLSHVLCRNTTGLHRMAYWEWGDPSNPHVVVCVHGLSRQGRDFDFLAQALAADYRVVCPDVVGRGQSDWLRDPSGYTNWAYAADMVTLIARLNVEHVDWVGTSMGGLIGLILASFNNAPVRRLVLNDVGPAISHESVARIGSYLGQRGRWATVEAAADALWAISTGFGPHTREQWLALSRPMLKPDGDAWVLHYDPAIAQVFSGFSAEMAQAGEAVLWHMYDTLRCPTLLLRGAESDLLSSASALAMTQRGPQARLHEFAGVGHAPMLTNAEQVAVVQEFLRAP
jgi:pimeloyl-ACP methyl ester carboxylesterase